MDGVGASRVAGLDGVQVTLGQEWKQLAVFTVEGADGPESVGGGVAFGEKYLPNDCLFDQSGVGRMG